MVIWSICQAYVLIFFYFHLFHENHDLKSIKVSLKFSIRKFLQSPKNEVLQAYVMRSFIFFWNFTISLLLIISWFSKISWIPLVALWGLTKPTYTPNLKSISQSRTELWPKIGFKHISRSVGHLESDDLEKQVSFSFWAT